MIYREFNQLLLERTETLRQEYPLSMFVLDHYVRLLLVDHTAPIHQHLGYLRQVASFGRLVDFGSRIMSSETPQKHTSKIIVSNTLILAFGSLIQDLVSQKSDFSISYFGLAKYNLQISRRVLGYFSLYSPLFSRVWTRSVRQGIKSVLELDRNNFSTDFSDLEASTAQVVRLLRDKLKASRVQHVLALRDFFWYEAALILACREAGTKYHVIAHGYPHISPEEGEVHGFLPFRGDYLYCLHENSRRQLEPYIDQGKCCAIQPFSARSNFTGHVILFISSDMEEIGHFDPSFRLQIYQQLQRASTACGMRVVVRFREDEDLVLKIAEAKAFGFQTKIKTDCPLEEDLAEAGFVFGFQSTALFLSSEFGCPTYLLGRYEEGLPGIAQIEPKEILAQVIRLKDSDVPLKSDRPQFSEAFFSNLAQDGRAEVAC